jgi:Ca-activated chloride channel family protein
MSQDYAGIQSGGPRADVREAITELGLNFRLMTQFTSFVAVEEMTITDGGEPRRIEVPVELPEGVNREGVFGKDEQDRVTANYLARRPVYSAAALSNLPINGRNATSEIATLKTGSIPPPPSPPPPKAKPSKSPGKGSGSVGGIGSGSGSGVGPGAGSGIGGGSAYNKPLSPEEQKRQEILSKLNPSIAAVIERLKSKTSQPGADEAKFVRNGKAEIQVWLADKSPETLAQLKELGLEVVLDPKAAKMIIGRVPIEKLAALAELKAVLYIAPMASYIAPMTSK